MVRETVNLENPPYQAVVTADQTSGSLEFQYEFGVTQNIGVPENLEIEISTTGVSRFNQLINNIVDDIVSQGSGITADLIRQQITSEIDDTITEFQQLSLSEQFEPDIGGQVSGRVSTSIPTIEIPVPAGVNGRQIISENIRQIDRPRFVVRFTQPSTFGIPSGFGGFVGGSTVVEGEIIIEDELFIDVKEAQLDCSSLPNFNDVSNDLAGIMNDVQGIKDNIESQKQKLEDIEQDLGITISTQSESGSDGFSGFGFDGGLTVQSPSSDEFLESLSSQSIGDTELRDIQEQAQEIQNAAESASVRRQQNRLDNVTTDDLPQRCISELDPSVTEVTNVLSETSNLISRTQAEIAELLSLINIGLNTEIDTKCVEKDQFQDINSRLDEFGNLLGITVPIRDGSISTVRRSSSRIQTPLPAQGEASLPSGVNPSDIDFSEDVSSTTLNNLTKSDLRDIADNLSEEISIAGSRGGFTITEYDTSLSNKCANLLQSKLNEITSVIGNLGTATPSVNCAQELRGLDRDIEQVESQVGLDTSFEGGQFVTSSDKPAREVGAGLNQSQVRDLSDTVNDLENQVRSQLGPTDECYQEFINRVQRLNSRVGRLSGLAVTQDCDQKYSDISSSLTSLEQALDDAPNIPESNSQAIGDFTRELNDVRDRIDAEVDEKRCRAQFYGETSSLEKSLDAKTTSPRNTFCEQEFEDLADTADDLEERSSRLDNRVVSGLERRVQRGETFLPGRDIPELQNEFIAKVEQLEEEQRQFERNIQRTVTASEVPRRWQECRQHFFERNAEITNNLNGLIVRLETLDEQSLSCGDVSVQLQDDVASHTQDTDAYFNQTRVQQTESQKDELITTGQSLLDEIENQVDDANPCKSSLRREVSRNIQRLRGTTGSSPPSSRPGCPEVKTRLKNAVETFEVDASTFVSKRLSQRTKEKRDRLIQQGNEVRSRVNENVPEENTCKDKLRNRINTQLQRLRTSRIRPTVAKPCEDRFTETGARLEAFEDRVLNLTAPVTPQQIQLISESGDEVITMIRNNVPADDECRKKMINRVRRLINRTRSLTAQVRIEEAQEGDQDREELLQSILTDLEQIEPEG